MHTPLPPDASLPADSQPGVSRARTPALERPVSMIMTTGDLITADVSDDVSEAIEIFRQGRISHIPVLSEGSKLVGVVSPADILKLPNPPIIPPVIPPTTAAVAGKRGRIGIRIADVMTKNIETIRPTVNLRQAAQLFISGGFHSLLVTASDGELLGILTTSDILRASIGEHVPDSGD
jgi:CBS domain-containing protein